MKRFGILALLLLAAHPALAQQAPPPSPQDQLQALSGQLIEEMQQVIQWRTKALADEAEIARLQVENDKLKKAVDPPKR